jgi:hypothetical protein
MLGKEASKRKSPLSRVRNTFTSLLSRPETRNWLDIGIFAVGLYALQGIFTTDSPALQNLFTELFGGTALFELLSVIDRMKGMSTQRLDRIDQGTEIFKRSGALTLAFGGQQGHDTLDSLFKLEPSSTIPIFDTTQGSETIRTWIQNTRPAGFSIDKHDIIKSPYFINLELGGKNLVLGNSSNFNLIEFGPDNILATENGEKRFVTYGFGASFDECLLKQSSTGIPPERYLLSHEQLRKNAISQDALTLNDESIMVMIDDGTRVMDPPEKEFAKNMFSSENMIWIDPVTTVFRSIRKLFKDKEKLTLNFTTPNERYLENVALDSLGFYWFNKPEETLRQAKSNYDRFFPDDKIEVIFENNDALTIVNSVKKNENKEKGDVVALFRSEIAYEIAHKELEKLGIKCQCVAIILRDQVKEVQKKIKNGDSVVTIQESLDTETNWEKYQQAYADIVGGKNKTYRTRI